VALGAATLLGMAAILHASACYATSHLRLHMLCQWQVPTKSRCELCEQAIGPVALVLCCAPCGCRHGVNLTKVPLPVELCEARSFLQRLTDSWCYTDLLHAAAAARWARQLQQPECSALAF
jgi:hypothetical protein